MTKSKKFYFGFKQTKPAPPGVWVLCGPFDTYDEAMSDRQNSLAWDCELSIPFYATSRGIAEAMLKDLEA